MNLRRIRTGRSAEIYEWEPGWVLKLARPEFSMGTEIEARNYLALRDSALPIPEVRGLVEVENRLGLVIQHVKGRSMLDVLKEHPERHQELAERFLQVWDKIHRKSGEAVVSLRARIEWGLGKSGLPPEVCDGLLEKAESLIGERPVLCHFDFHPDNLLVDGDEVVVIDWLDACQGPVAADYARSLLLMGFPKTSPENLPTFVRIVHDHVMAECREAVEAWIPVVAGARLGEGFEGQEAEDLRSLAVVAF